MSTRPTSKKIENSCEGFGNGQDLKCSEQQTTSEKSKVDFIYDAVPCQSKHDIVLVLQSCDYNVDAAISIFSQGKADEILNQWSHKGKKNKNVNKKKQNKKKQPTKEAVGSKVQAVSPTASSTNQQSDVIAEKPAKDLSLDLPASSSSTSPVTNGISPTSDHTTPISTMSGKKPSQHTKHHHSTSHSSSHHSKHANDHSQHNFNEHSTEKLSPTSRSDALKKSTKDLQRSSFSLARYQVVLEEECEQSLKQIAKTFESIRNCVSEREQFLTQSLKEFKEEAVKLLQQRLEDASALKLKTDRVHSMPDEQVALLRADIKSFVAERKLDEELAQTKRFVCDEEKLLQDLKTFGQVVPIKGTYTPVILNHVLPSTTSKSSSTSSSTASRPTATTNSTPSTLSSIPATTNTSKNPTTSADKPSVVPHKNVNSQSSMITNVKTTTQPPSVSITSQTQTVNKKENAPQHQSTESHQKSSSVESQRKVTSQKTTVDSHSKTTSQKPQQKDTKQKTEQHGKAVPQHGTQKQEKSELHRKTAGKQVEQKNKKMANGASGETKSKERNAPSSKATTLKHRVQDLSHASIDSSAAKFTGPPPNISTLISLAMAKSSAAVSDGSKDSTPNQQETASDAEQNRDGRNQSKNHNRGQRNRPTTASEHQGKPQRNREPRSNRPQSTRQRRDKENDSKPVNTTNDQSKTNEEKQSEQPQESRRRRQRRRRDRKPREGEATTDDQEKDSQPASNIEGSTEDQQKQESEKDSTEESQQVQENEATNKECSKIDDTTSTDRASSNDQLELHVIDEENVVSQTNNAEKGSDDATITHTETVDQEVNKDEKLENSTEGSHSPKRNGISSHADDTVVEERTEEKNDHLSNADGALPQRPQHRRRNRGSDANNESAIEDHNGSTNGVNHDTGNETSNGDKQSSETSQEEHHENVNGKLTIVPALINGHEVPNGTNESGQLGKLAENKIEIQDHQAPSNNTGDDCLVER